MAGGDKITSIHGHAIAPPGEPNQQAIDTLTELLEMAKSGEIVGVAASVMHFDSLSSFRVSGRVGGYSMLGALSVIERVLIDINEEAD